MSFLALSTGLFRVHEHVAPVYDVPLVVWSLAIFDTRDCFLFSLKQNLKEPDLELVSKELNHLAAILHVYAGGLNFMKLKKKKYYF